MTKLHHLSEYQANIKSVGVSSVKKFFEDNPYMNMKDCARSTGLSYQTVLRHVKYLKENPTLSTDI